MTQPSSTQSSTDERPLPIDIDYVKCLPWLIDRRRVPRDWHLQLKTARTLARSAWAQTSPEIRTSLSLPLELSAHDTLTYAQVLHVYRGLTAEDVCEEWGSTQFDLLGRHVDPVRRAWKNALLGFEKNHVCLADLAQNIVRNVDVEAPALRDRIAKLTTDAADLARKDGPAVRAVTDMTERFRQECAQYNIDPNVGPNADFDSLISRFLDACVPHLLRDAVVALKDLDTVVSFYKQFAEFVARPDPDERPDQGDSLSSPLCSVLTAIFSTAEESLIRLIPRPTLSSSDVPFSSNMDENTTINNGVASTEPDENSAGGAIDWGIEIDDSGTGNEYVGGAINEGIDWSIDIGSERVSEPTASTEPQSKHIDAPSGIDWDITVDSSEGVAQQSLKGPSPQVMTLSDGSTRRAVLNDVYELRAFVESRMSDAARVQNAHVALSAQLNSGMGMELGRVSLEEMQSMRGKIGRAIDKLASHETRHVLSMYDLPRARTRAARNVRDRRLAIDRLRDDVTLLSARRARITHAISEESPKFKQLARETWRVVSILELELSKLYDGRDVNIIGEIHNVFPSEAQLNQS